MIEIDDSGTGDIVGDAFIGFLKKETGEIIFRTLSVNLFKDENWENKMPLKKTVELIKDGLEELNFQPDSEKIHLCRGNIFDEVRAYFTEEGINYEDAIIEGKLQDAVEGKLIEHLRNDLGVRSKSLTKKSGAKRFFVLFNWVCYDFYKREKYVKSGFKKWNTVWRERGIKKFNKIQKSKKKQHY
ncbi:MAG: hypothetical protein KAT57_04635 [Candidatus Lokiarchaeota archaeon]|nr:hypothetical protein [Candidatus Lokiarchaeota archaeon]